MKKGASTPFKTFFQIANYAIEKFSQRAGGFVQADE
jgi:hypothetical protein